MTPTPPTPPAWVDKTRLVDLIAGYRELPFNEKFIRLSLLRRYLNEQDWDVVIDEVRTIDDLDDLKVLVGAGVPGRVYYAVMAQMAYLSGVV